MKQKNLVLMVVAVGCGLAAAFLTSQMSAKTAQVDTQDVIVAAKDLPVGMMMTKDEIPKLLKRKKVSKDAIPPGIVETEEEFVEKRLSRAVRAEETINKADLTKGGVVTIPHGMHLVTLQLDAAHSAGGFAGPGSHVDILASIRLDNKLTAMPVLVNMLILAVDTKTTYNAEGVFPTVSTVSFAANRKQGLVLELAKARGCPMSLLLRNPDDTNTEYDRTFDIDRVIKLLQDQKNPAQLDNPGENEGIPPKEEQRPTPKADTPAPGSADGPKPEAVVKVPTAAEDIAPGTEITNDLIAEKFKTVDLPKGLAEGAIADLTPHLGQVFRTGLGKGQWVTKSLVGPVELKPAPRDPDVLPKDPSAERARSGPPVKRAIHDVTVHTASDTKVFRYQEVEPGRWRMLGEVRPDRGAPQAVPPEAADKPQKPEKQVE